MLKRFFLVFPSVLLAFSLFFGPAWGAALPKRDFDQAEELYFQETIKLASFSEFWRRTHSLEAPEKVKAWFEAIFRNPEDLRTILRKDVAFPDLFRLRLLDSIVEWTTERNYPRGSGWELDAKDYTLAFLSTFRDRGAEGHVRMQAHSLFARKILPIIQEGTDVVPNVRRALSVYLANNPQARDAVEACLILTDDEDGAADRLEKLLDRKGEDKYITDDVRLSVLEAMRASDDIRFRELVQLQLVEYLTLSNLAVQEAALLLLKDNPYTRKIQKTERRNLLSTSALGRLAVLINPPAGMVLTLETRRRAMRAVAADNKTAFYDSGFAHHPEMLDALRAALASSDWAIRLQATADLARIKPNDEATVLALLRLVADEMDEKIRKWAFQAIGGQEENIRDKRLISVEARVALAELLERQLRKPMPAGGSALRRHRMVISDLIALLAIERPREPQSFLPVLRSFRLASTENRPRLREILKRLKELPMLQPEERVAILEQLLDFLVQDPEERDLVRKALDRLSATADDYLYIASRITLSPTVLAEIGVALKKLSIDQWNKMLSDAKSDSLLGWVLDAIDSETKRDLLIRMGSVKLSGHHPILYVALAKLLVVEDHHPLPSTRIPRLAADILEKSLKVKSRRAVDRLPIDPTGLSSLITALQAAVTCPHLDLNDKKLAWKLLGVILVRRGTMDCAPSLAAWLLFTANPEPEPVAP